MRLEDQGASSPCEDRAGGLRPEPPTASQPEALVPLRVGDASLFLGDCRDTMATLEADSVDSCVTDPPYHLTSIVKRFGAENAAPAKAGKTGAYARASAGFMGQKWDGGDVAFRPETWAAVLRVLKPGAHLVAFSGTRTYHRMVCAIEDAGFEIRDQLAYCYGSGFPKSHDAERSIAVVSCRQAGRHFKRRLPDENKQQLGDHICSATVESEPWQGWGTALKPAWEPICLARKPLAEKTVAANILAHGTGALNIDGCRIDTTDSLNGGAYSGDLRQREEYSSSDTVPGAAPLSRLNRGAGEYEQPSGRWPGNIIHDGSDEVLAGFPSTESGSRLPGRYGGMGFHGSGEWEMPGIIGDSGSAARFFYCAKTSAAERHIGCDDKGNTHPTVKPVDLMRWLTRLVTPKGGLVLDPFAGSGSTLIAASWEGFRSIGCELSPEYLDIARRRLTAAQIEIEDSQRQLSMFIGEAA